MSLYALSKCFPMANLRLNDVARSQQTAHRLAKGRHFELRYINKVRLARDRADLIKLRDCEKHFYLAYKKLFIRTARGQKADAGGGKEHCSPRDAGGRDTVSWLRRQERQQIRQGIRQVNSSSGM